MTRGSEKHNINHRRKAILGRSKKMQKTIAVANQKGGVGKSTLTAHVAWGYARKGLKVLVIDTDGQANGTHALYGASRIETSTYHLFIEGADVLPVKTTNANIDIIPADERLHDVDALPFGNYMFFVNRVAELGKKYDVVLIDTPPSLGLRLTAALCVATDVIIPLPCSYFSVAGLKQLEKTIKAIQNKINKHLKISAYVPNLFRNTKKHKGTLELLLNKYADLVVSTPLRYSEYIESAVESGHPVWERVKLGGQRNASANMTTVISGIIEKVGE